MSRIQKIAVALAVALGALDGFDVLAISFAAPVIARAWTISPAALGIVLSSGLAGMAAGSFLLGPVADRVGRRPALLLSLVIMAVGMLLTASADSIIMLCVWRVVTGLGIGGVVPTINSVAAEFANERRRDLCIGLMTVGFPLGGLLGGFLSAELIELHGWRSIFVAGGIVTAIFVPMVFFLLRESPEYLFTSRRPDRLKRINVILQDMGHPPLSGLPEPGHGADNQGRLLLQLIGQKYRRVFLLLIAAYFLHIMTYYFFAGWLPEIAVVRGFVTGDAIRMSSIMNMGGVLGGIALGLAAPILGLKRAVIVAMAGTSIMLAIFAHLSGGLTVHNVAAFVQGIFFIGGMVGLSSLLARSFPAHLRVSGTGFAIGFGRGGAVLGPMLGGFLLQAGLQQPTVVTLVGSASFVAALALTLLRVENLEMPTSGAIWKRARRPT